jgi:hypothetical protein
MWWSGRANYDREGCRRPGRVVQGDGGRAIDFHKLETKLTKLAGRPSYAY